MGIAGNEWGFQVGTLPKGARDKIVTPGTSLILSRAPLGSVPT